MNPNIHTAEVLPPRAMLFLGVVALHVLFAYFLTSGLMRATIQILLPPMEGVILKDPDPPKQQKAVEQDPRFLDPTVTPVPPPPIPLDPPDEPVFANAVPEIVGDSVPFQPAAPAAEPPIRLVGRNVMPNTEDYYPANERRREIEGTAVVRACVNENGRLDGAPVVEMSSGRPALDTAAMRVARDGRYARSMRGDMPVPNCHRFRVTFSMH